jgi:hypothetical protein
MLLPYCVLWACADRHAPCTNIPAVCCHLLDRGFAAAVCCNPLLHWDLLSHKHRCCCALLDYLLT